MSTYGYEDSPEPLTDNERRLLKRMFSDFFEVPGEWKTSLKAELERDPPILGTQTLGGSTVSLKAGQVLDVHIADGAGIQLSKLASSGQIGTTSGVEVQTNGVRFGGDTTVARSAAGQVDVQKLRARTNLASATQTPLWLNVNGTDYQVLVGPAASGPGGVGRALYVNF